MVYCVGVCCEVIVPAGGIPRPPAGWRYSDCLWQRSTRLLWHTSSITGFIGHTMQKGEGCQLVQWAMSGQRCMCFVHNVQPVHIRGMAEKCTSCHVEALKCYPLRAILLHLQFFTFHLQTCEQQNVLEVNVFENGQNKQSDLKWCCSI